MDSSLEIQITRRPDLPLNEGIIATKISKNSRNAISDANPTKNTTHGTHPSAV
jgi:hypothetical protein